MKARALKTAVAFYLQSRRRLGFALESEGALLENLVRHARQLREVVEHALGRLRHVPASRLGRRAPPVR